MFLDYISGKAFKLLELVYSFPLFSRQSFYTLLFYNIYPIVLYLFMHLSVVVVVFSFVCCIELRALLGMGIVFLISLSPRPGKMLSNQYFLLLLKCNYEFMNLGKKACNSLSVSFLLPLGGNCHIGYMRNFKE